MLSGCAIKTPIDLVKIMETPYLGTAAEDPGSDDMFYFPTQVALDIVDEKTRLKEILASYASLPHTVIADAKRALAEHTGSPGGRRARAQQEQDFHAKTDGRQRFDGHQSRRKPCSEATAGA